MPVDLNGSELRVVDCTYQMYWGTSQAKCACADACAVTESKAIKGGAYSPPWQQN